MEINNITCVGAGLIGSDWAALFSSKGYEVIIQDRSEELLEKALGRIRSNLGFMEKNDLLGAGNVEESLAKIKTTTDIPEAVAKADYVQESVPDNYEIKKKVFKEMDGAAPRSTILASSASGLLMTEIQPAVSAPERCILVHPMLPAHLVPTVEIAGGRQTSLETVASTRSFMEKLGKTPVVLKKEVSGYIVNRLQAALIREAIDLVDQGVASPEDIDTAFCQGIGLRSPITGPFLRMHLAGEGIADFLANFMESYRYRWESMATWTTVPPSAVKAVVEGTEQMDLVKRKSLAEIRSWRDEMLVKLLRTMQEGLME
ncbi:MAG TPA: 3-hydroxyacyl-CoA dehydrogenase family protein [Desulfobacteraceae bacterium]|nr:3-hydroxyacyl-CoA dehydrogenase family protein [Desulfobacteraceae bacterium]